MIPLECLSFEKYCHKYGEHGERDDLLNHLELHQAERAAVAVESDSVGRNLCAIFEERHSP